MHIHACLEVNLWQSIHSIDVPERERECDRGNAKSEHRVGSILQNRVSCAIKAPLGYTELNTDYHPFENGLYMEIVHATIRVQSTSAKTINHHPTP